MMLVPHRKLTYSPLRPVIGIALLYVDDVRISGSTLWASTVCYGDTFTFALEFLALISPR
jgi:hypothetical protein